VVAHRAETTEANMMRAKARPDVRAVKSRTQQPTRRHFVNLGFV
jgi:hypothetical protein